jgi:hypothetical protein
MFPTSNFVEIRPVGADLIHADCASMSKLAGTFRDYEKALINPFVTSGTYMCVPLTKSLQVRWDNSIPLFLHAAIYLEVSLFR